MDPQERSVQMRLASYRSWANTADRSARTANARKASHERFLVQARQMHPDASDEQVAQAAEMLRRAHFTELSQRSAQARRIRREEKQREKQRRIEEQLAAHDRAKDTTPDTAVGDAAA